ncbi:uncharacterized protein METZ01_LOCUS289670 [marine metagenome]|uniref:Uncharacterized protein n=1 Tax=marine metagenome TaxID=408172 RepID=A0A382LJQ4_9ZZZZ
MAAGFWILVAYLIYDFIQDKFY